jgi:hypothetical protein
MKHGKSSIIPFGGMGRAPAENRLFQWHEGFRLLRNDEVQHFQYLTFVQ